MGDTEESEGKDTGEEEEEEEEWLLSSS